MRETVDTTRGIGAAFEERSLLQSLAAAKGHVEFTESPLTTSEERC
jgi:hypothetical protein